MAYTIIYIVIGIILRLREIDEKVNRIDVIEISLTALLWPTMLCWTFWEWWRDINWSEWWYKNIFK